MVNKYVPALQVTLLNLGGSNASTTALMAGNVDYDTSISTAIYEASHGTGSWQGQPPYEDFRILSVGYAPIDLPCVLATSDIISMKDFEGRKLSAGMLGGGTEAKIKASFEALGIEPDWFIGSLNECSCYNARQQNRWISKTLTPKRLDSVHINLMSMREIKFIDFSDEEVEIIRDNNPWLIFVRFAPGEFEPIPNPDQVLNFVAHWNVGPIVRKDFSDDFAF